MSLLNFIPLLFLYLFGVINLLGIRPDLVLISLMHAGIGLFLFFIIRYLQINKHFFRLNATFFYWFFIGLLVFTYFLGTEVKGSRRWIDLYFFPLQVSELFKVFFIVSLSQLLAGIRTPIQNNQAFIRAFVLMIVPFVLVLKQPDLGSALILFAIFFVMVLHSSIPKKQIAVFLIVIILFLPLAWFGLHDYQQERLLSFVRPTQDLAGTSYNMAQARIAIGSGNLIGKGLGLGKQSQLMFLPEYHTDFAYASLVEQFGFVGGLLVILLYAMFFFLLFRRLYVYIGKKDVNERYALYYLLGFSVFIILQTGINIGMNVGLVPIAGITLPFISYGGSSLITFLIALALIP